MNVVNRRAEALESGGLHAASAACSVAVRRALARRRGSSTSSICPEPFPNNLSQIAQSPNGRRFQSRRGAPTAPGFVVVGDIGLHLAKSGARGDAARSTLCLIRTD